MDLKFLLYDMGYLGIAYSYWTYKEKGSNRVLYIAFGPAS